jgi:hemolysin III
MPNIARWIKEPYCGLSHLTGSLLSIAGLVVLLSVTHATPWHYVAFAIYGASLILLYTASGLLHSIRCDGKMEDRLERFDYSSIFILIAGTYTPLCLTILRGPWGWSLFGVEWGLAALGITAVLVTSRRPDKLTMPLYIGMGWLAVVAIGPLVHRLPAGALFWLISGGVAYSVGAVIFALDRPRLWPGRFGAHDLWHTLVLTGSACHFVMMVRFIA